MYLFLFRVLGCDVVYQCWHAAVHFCATLSSSDEIQSKAICHIFNFIDPAWLYLYKLRPRKLVQVRNFTHFKTYLQFCIQLYVIMQSIFFFLVGTGILHYILQQSIDFRLGWLVWISAVFCILIAHTNFLYQTWDDFEYYFHVYFIDLSKTHNLNFRIWTFWRWLYH